MKKKKYVFLGIVGLFIVTLAVILWQWPDRGNLRVVADRDDLYAVTDRGEIHVVTDASAFISANSIVEESNGEIYLLTDVTPAPAPEEAGVIYRAAKRGQTVLVTLKNSSPPVTFQIVGGLTQGDKMRIKCASRSEAEALSSHLKVLRWRE